MDGILNINKPKGYTSRDIVNIVSKHLGTKKVGHTGTLDPDVEGVLVLCINRATKIIELLQDTDKVYKCELTIGTSTNTEDSSGEIVDSKKVATISKEQLESVLEQLTGEITQIPPMYSAVKYKGKELYKYAYDGITIEDRPIRKVCISSINLTSDITYSNDTAKVSFDVTCSKGTYVRTLCVMIGELLGYPAHMSYLQRTKTSTQYLKDSYTLEQFERGEYEIIDIKDVLQIEELNLPHYEIPDKSLRLVQNGSKLNNNDYPDKFVFYHIDTLVIYMVDPNDKKKIRPFKKLR